MAKNTEIELKLVVSKDNLKKLLALDCVTDALRAGSMQKRKLVSSYYDTEDLAFKRQGIAYRVRSKGDGTYEATVKTSVQNAAGLSERMELNLPLASARPKLEGFGDLGLPTELTELAPNGVSKLFTVTVQRTTYILDLQGAVAELAVDHGKIVAGKDNAEPIDEVEIELLEGDKGVLLELAAKIAAAVPVFVEKRSKFVRGLALRGIMADEAPVKEKLGTGLVKDEVLAALAGHGEQLLTLQQKLNDNVSEELLKGLRRELLACRSLATLAGVEECALLTEALSTVENVRRLLALQALWQRIMFKGLLLGRSSLQKKLAEATLMAVQKLQQAAASGHFTAIVFALVSMVYKAELADASVEASVKDALKQWQQVLLQKVPGTLSVDGKDIVSPDDGDGEAMLLPIKLAAAENISALARCTNLKAAAKASEAVKKQRRQLHKQAVLVGWQEQLQAICDASTSKLVYRETGMILGYLLAKK